MTELSEGTRPMLAASHALRAMPEYGGIDEQQGRSRIPLQLLATGSLDAYIQSIRNIPVLDAEEELHLARRFRLQDDAMAAQTLVLSTLRFLVHIARDYLGYGLAFADLIQEGNVGLLIAVKRFDPEVGVRLISFAVHWIKTEIHEFILKNWRIVKIATTKAHRKLLFSLRRYKKRLGWMKSVEVEAVATELGFRPADVLQMEERLGSADIAFDVLDVDDDAPRLAPERHLTDHFDAVADTEATDWTEQYQARLAPAPLALDARSREIVQSRWLCGADEPATLQSLDAKYGVSAERIRQIQQRALDLLRIAMDCAVMKPGRT